VNYSIINVEQRTAPWFEARRGRLTGSVAGDITAKGRGGEEAVKRRDLRMRLALERATNKYLESNGFVSSAMKRGIEMESEARAVYEAVSGRMVSEVGFVASSDSWMGYSPDGIVLDGDRIVHVVELKCPEWAAHWDYIHSADIGKAYRMQICHGFLVTGCETLDWMSYNADYPEKLQHVLLSFQRSDIAEELAQYAEAAKSFLCEVDAMAAEVERLSA
jgi:hypothetical protein